jgi:branched-chain amino acid transport system permease protein
MTVTDLRVEAVRQHNALSRVRVGEVLFWIGCAAAYFVFPDRHLLMNEMAILGLFALSLDLILGYAGILSLGHAAFFGLGAYTAGIITKYGITDPIAGLGIAALFAAITGFFTSFLVLRGSELTKLMVTLGIALVLQEVANRNGWITGGADGLQGMNIGAVFGETYGFDFDIFGAVANAYSLITLFVLFLIARRIIHSPFGWSLRSLRDNPLRAAAIGIPVNARLVAVYTLAAAYAGIAGALLAQTTQFVSLDVLAFHRSADVLLILTLGGVGYLYGGLNGALVFRLMQDVLSNLTPQYWEFWIGLVLVTLVLAGRQRMGRNISAVFARFRPAPATPPAPAE